MEQQKSSRSQSSENIFFQLFRTHVEKTNGIKSACRNLRYPGVDSFEAMIKELKLGFGHRIVEKFEKDLNLNFEEVGEEFLLL